MGYLQSAPNADVNFSDDARDDAEDDAYSTGGHHFFAEPTIQMKVGKIAARSKFAIEYWKLDLEDEDDYFYDATLDTLVPNEKVLWSNDTDLIYMCGQLTFGVRYSAVFPGNDLEHIARRSAHGVVVPHARLRQFQQADAPHDPRRYFKHPTGWVRFLTCSSASRSRSDSWVRRRTDLRTVDMVHGVGSGDRVFPDPRYFMGGVMRLFMKWRHFREGRRHDRDGACRYARRIPAASCSSRQASRAEGLLAEIAPEEGYRKRICPTGVSMRVLRRDHRLAARMIEVDGAGIHDFANPDGVVFRIRCFSRAEGCFSSGASTEAHTGSRFFLALRALQGMWRADGLVYESRSSGFYGLILRNLAEGGAYTSTPGRMVQYPRVLALHVLLFKGRAGFVPKGRIDHVVIVGARRVAGLPGNRHQDGGSSSPKSTTIRMAGIHSTSKSLPATYR